LVTFLAAADSLGVVSAYCADKALSLFVLDWTRLLAANSVAVLGAEEVELTYESARMLATVTSYVSVE